MIPRETDFTKQESSTSDNTKASSSSTISWSRLKDPRIVRVSRAFGGKDRHSKVCTVRGLRDRRVRLSVPTAIQLYDLQDRLGLNQPSKVVDWLLNAAKHEIDELPPLQIPQGTFSQNLQPLLSASQELRASQSDKQGPKTDWDDPILRQHRSNIYTGKSKEVSGETSDHRADDESWARNEEERQFNLQNPSSLPNLMNSSIPYNSFVRWDPSNLTLSHPSRSHGLSSQQEDWHNFSLGSLQPPLSGSHQVLLYQPGMSTQPYFPTEFDPKQMNFQNSQLSTSSLSSPVDHSTAQPVRPIHFNMGTANLLPSQNNDESQRDKGKEFHSGQP